MRTIKGYLDSNVLINYIWWSRSNSRPRTRESAAMAEAIETGAFDPVISRFCLMEVAGHFRDYQILRLLIRDGFSYRQFPQKRKNYTLSKRSENRIRDLVRELESDRHFSVVTITGWTDKAYSDIERYVEGYVDLPDAFHLQAAATAACDCFVTGDDEFRQRVKAMIEKKAVNIQLKMMSPREFLDLEEVRSRLRPATIQP